MREREEIRAERAVRAVLPAPVADRIVADNLFGRLAWQLHLAELDGIDPVDALRELEDDLILVEDERDPADYLARLLVR
ncbi:MAG: hypothetical protein ACRDQ4_21890 [Pseudonocardiaceae bacterium]